MFWIRGRIITDASGNLRPVYPFFCYSSSDWQECKLILPTFLIRSGILLSWSKQMIVFQNSAKLTTLTLDTNKTAFPCGFCMCPKEFLNELAIFYPWRTKKDMIAVYERATQMKRGKEKHCKQYSLKFQKVAQLISFVLIRTIFHTRSLFFLGLFPSYFLP